MTGTGKTEEEEFREIYNIRVIPIPTNRPIARIDHPDLLYPSLKSKFKAVVEDVKSRHEKGQPVLVGTVAVETSDYLSQLLVQAGVPSRSFECEKPLQRSANHHERWSTWCCYYRD